MRRLCRSCEEIRIIIKEFNFKKHLKNSYQSYEKVIGVLTKLYEEGTIELYAADFHFKDTMQVLYDETNYTVQQYFYCNTCKQMFAIGACIRGTPYFKVINDIKKKKYDAIFNHGIHGKLGIYYGNPRFIRSRYSYIFNGTREELINQIETKEYDFSKKEKSEYHLLNYSESNISLGIGRTRHSGGYFFNASLLASDNQIIIDGDIEEERPYIPEMTKGEKIFFTSLGVIFFIPGIIIKLFFTLLGLEETNLKRRKKLNIFFIKYIKCEKNIR